VNELKSIVFLMYKNELNNLPDVYSFIELYLTFFNKVSPITVFLFTIIKS